MIELLERGGPVVWVLAGYSVLALSIVIERLLHFARMRGLPEQFDSELQSTADPQIYADMRGPEAAVVHAMFTAKLQGVTDIYRVAVRKGSEELQRMERGFQTLSWLGNTAPLLGLLGTITGMIKAFMVIESAGGRVDAQALAGGIWEAMVTTGVGLIVALPVLFMVHLLEGMADKRAHAMQRAASLVLEHWHLPHSDQDRIEHIQHRRGSRDAL